MSIINGYPDGGNELDPTGADVTSDPIQYTPDPPEEGTGSLLPYPSFSNPTRPGTSYQVDGIPVSTDYFMMVLDNNYHGSFTGGSLRSSIIGYQYSGSRFGRPYNAKLDLNGGTASVWEGEFDSNLLSSPLPQMASPIYGSSLSWGFGLLPQNPYPGFSKDKFQAVDKALSDGAKLLQKSDCQKELAKAGINVTELIKNFNNFSARPDSASGTKGYNIFSAEKSTDPQIQQFLKTERGKSSGAFIYGQAVMVRDAFFSARGGAAIGADISRALALIHEAIHLTGKSDADFGGSSKLNDVVIHACWSKLYGHKDLAIVGN